MGLKLLYHARDLAAKRIEITVDNINVNIVIEHAVVLVFPIMIADFHISAVFAENVFSDVFAYGRGDVHIYVIVRFFIEILPRAGTSQRYRLNLLQRGKVVKKLIDHGLSPPAIIINDKNRNS